MDDNSLGAARHGRTTAATRPPRGRAGLREMGPADVPFVVREHLHHFPDGFFARLGPGFLTRYYRSYISGPYARAHIAVVDGRPAGYLVGLTNPSAHRQHILRTQGRALLLSALRGLLARPGLAVHFLRTRGRLYARKLLRTRRPAESAVPGPDRVAVLDHVAVTDDAQRRGIGSALVERFVSDAAAAGCGRVTLVTVAGADGAGEYYAERGWHWCGEHCTPEGRSVATYDRPVRADTGGQATHSVG